MRLIIKESKGKYNFIIRTKIGRCRYKVEGHKEKTFCKACEEGFKEIEFIKENTIVT